MRRTLTACVLTLLICTPLSAFAIPVTYQMRFTVLSGQVVTAVVPTPSGPPTITAADAAGNIYLGLFSLDSDILLTDGIGKLGNLNSFFVQMEDNIWGFNSPANNSFAGFRGPAGTLGSPSPGFDVVNGEITNIRGGVYGPADVPFVNFSFGTPNTFDARGLLTFHQDGTPSSMLSGPDVGGALGTAFGTFEIIRVPEPATVVLFGLALAALGLARRREIARNNLS